jgi:hypothetical protein
MGGAVEEGGDFFFRVSPLGFSWGFVGLGFKRILFKYTGKKSLEDVLSWFFFFQKLPIQISQASADLIFYLFKLFSVFFLFKTNIWNY